MPTDTDDQIKELYERTNIHEKSIAVIETKLNMIIALVSAVCVVCVGILFNSLAQTKERTDQLYYNNRSEAFPSNTILPNGKNG